MRIGLVTRHLGLPVGFGSYAAGLMRALDEADAGHEYVVYAPARGDAPALSPAFRFRRFRVPALRSALVLWDLTAAPAAAALDRVDVLHYLYPAYPALAPRRPVVASVLDAIAFVVPGYELPAPYARLEARAARRADRVLTISQSARADIARVHSVPAERIEVTELGAPATDPVESPRGDYFLFVGGSERRKGVRDALEALEDARVGEMRLKVVGPHDASALFDARSDLPDVPRVDWLGRVGADELAALYRGALALVFPSRYEGFGLPVLEAMARRTPVIAARSSSIPDVAGDEAILVEPGDVEALRSAMERLRADAALRRELIDKGVRNAARFTWERTAQKTLAIYEAVARARSSSSKSVSTFSA